MSMLTVRESDWVQASHAHAMNHILQGMDSLVQVRINLLAKLSLSPLLTWRSRAKAYFWT